MENYKKTREWLVSNGYRHHHRAARKGYCRVAEIGNKVPYSGRWGEGYVVECGRYNGSTNYKEIEYWVK